MAKFTVRVTRVYPEDYADVEVVADDWDMAKDIAVEQAGEHAGSLFGRTPEPSYEVLPIDSDWRDGEDSEEDDPDYDDDGNLKPGVDHEEDDDD